MLLTLTLSFQLQVYIFISRSSSWTFLKSAQSILVVLPFHSIFSNLSFIYLQILDIHYILSLTIPFPTVFVGFILQSVASADTPSW